jgi:hypothetical protein
VLGIDSFFANPRALDVDHAIPFGQAMGPRAVTFAVNTILNAIAGAIGAASARWVRRRGR